MKLKTKLRSVNITAHQQVADLFLSQISAVHATQMETTTQHLQERDCGQLHTAEDRGR